MISFNQIFGFINHQHLWKESVNALGVFWICFDQRKIAFTTTTFG